MVIKQFSTRPICWIQISTVDVINVAADYRCLWHSPRTKLTGPETISRWLLLKKRKRIPLWASLSGLRRNVRTPLLLVGKPMIDFIFVVIELFRYLLRLRRYERKSVEVGVFRSGVGHFERRFQREGASLEDTQGAFRKPIRPLDM